jgi:hypothetical protein
MIDMQSAAAALYGPAPAAPATHRSQAVDAAQALYGKPQPERLPPAPALADPAQHAARAMRQRGREPEELPEKSASGESLYASPETDDEPEATAEGNVESPTIDYPLSPDAENLYTSAVLDIEAACVNRLGYTHEQSVHSAQQFAGVMGAFGATGTDAVHVAEVVVAAAANGISDQRNDANRRAAIDTLRAEYGGDEGAQRAVRLAQALIARPEHAGIRAYLAETGLGNHPKVVSLVAAHAHRLAQPKTVGG